MSETSKNRQPAASSRQPEEDVAAGGTSRLPAADLPAADSCLIRPATAADIEAFYGQKFNLHTAVIDGRPVALGGFMKEDGRLWVFLDVLPDAALVGTAIVRALRHHLHKAGQDVYAHHDAAKFPEAARMLRLLGFKPTGETVNNMRVWKWPNS